jgi:glycosyltransferase involved in cell wall biosynthesis
MACGTPVIASANSSLVETVGDAGLLVDPYAADRIARALTAVLDDPELREKLSRRGTRRVKKFSWATAAERTMEALASVL